MIPLEDPEFFDKLILEGAMEFAGIDDDGEFLYNFTSKLPEVSPEMHERVVGNIYQEVQHLWSLGFVEMNVFEDNPTINISKKALDREELDKLSPYYRELIETIKKAARK